MSLLLALHSSSPLLGVGVQDLEDPDQAPQVAAFELGRGLSNQLLACIEELLPAQRWPTLARLAVATGPGGFTGTRLTVVLARTLAQQLQLPLDGISSFALIAARCSISEPTWLCQTLPRRGVVAGLYGPDPAAPGQVLEQQAPRLFAADAELPAGPQLDAEVRLPADVQQLLAFSAARAAAGDGAAPWQSVLPLYPTSPVAC
ncbi:MAG: tRNA (adenosine(37)-N6)-threonylcarbamoyltransferase complex dimerization subunit type 1 TsaB [Cyanobacteria bacterium M_surface_9_m1_291]|nr:tRNA (adenosine(37)-N6)-threonylcarbamoyltransferase complex dimerization subunit type 1 TsaB [Cyanobacteria bacterium M_surface_9_m1_291]